MKNAALFVIVFGLIYACLWALPDALEYEVSQLEARR